MVKLLLPLVAWSIGCCLFFPPLLFNPYKPRHCSCFWIPWQSLLVLFFKLLPRRKRWLCLFSCLFYLLKRNTKLITSGCSWRTTSFVVLLAVANFKEYVINTENYFTQFFIIIPYLFSLVQILLLGNTNCTLYFINFQFCNLKYWALAVGFEITRPKTGDLPLILSVA